MKKLTNTAGGTSIMATKRPYVIYFRPIYLLIAMVGVLLLALFIGTLFGDRVFVETITNNQQLKREITDLEENLADSQSALIQLQLSADVDAAALENARQKMVDMQSQIYRRDQELPSTVKCYKTISNPTDYQFMI